MSYGKIEPMIEAANTLHDQLLWTVIRTELELTRVEIQRLADRVAALEHHTSPAAPEGGTP